MQYVSLQPIQLIPLMKINQRLGYFWISPRLSTQLITIYCLKTILFGVAQKLPLQQKAICHLQKYQLTFSRNNVWCSPRFSSWATIFIIYTNDLPMSIKYSRCVLFAYDTTIYYSSNNLDDLYNKINHNLYTGLVSSK